MKRHGLDPVSLLCGLVFAGLALSLMTGVMNPSPRHLDLIWPAAVVLLGLALLASGRGRRAPGSPLLEPSVPGHFRVGDTRHTVADISAMRRLGWAPTIPVEQNVTEYLEWMPRYRDTKVYLEEAERAMREMNIVRCIGVPV